MLALNVRGGARVCIPADLAQITSYVLLEQEDWFEDEIRFVRRWLRPGMRAIDVGANFGAYTVAMAQAVGRNGAVWAFEPTPQTADLLQHTLGVNGFSHAALMKAAISDRPGSVAFSTNTCSELNAIAAAGASSAGVITVPATTLTHAAGEYGWDAVDFIKLDVEGHELEAFTGGEKFLSTTSPLVMFEIKAGANIDLRMLAPLAAMGYEFYRLMPGLLALLPFDAQEPVDGYQLNLFACKPDRAQELAAEGFLAEPDAGAGATVTADAWNEYAQTAPYARGLVASWPAKPGFFSGAGTRAYYGALAAFAQSRDAAESADRRSGLLIHAFQCAGQAFEADGSLGRTLSYARIAWEVGRREVAVDLLSRAASRIQAQRAQDLPEPFLAPSFRFEQIDPSTPFADWLHCAVTEQLEKVRSFSSFFVPEDSTALVGSICDNPYRSPEMERRRQLIRMRSRIQPGPECATLLAVRSDENLNPEFWCGGSQRA